MTQAVNIAQLGSQGTSLGFRNRIINGAMVIDQRNAGASVTPTDGQYTLDRWRCGLSQASKFSVQQNSGSVTPPIGFTNYLGVVSLSAYTPVSGDVFMLQQKIEGYNVADLGFGTSDAKTVTISFWVRSSLTGTFGACLFGENYYSYPFSYTIATANTWTQISVTISGNTTGTWLKTNGNGLELRINLGAGSSYQGTANTWANANYSTSTGTVNVVGTSGATFYITGVQLEVGSSATGFEYRQYTTELQLCQRYAYLALIGTQVAGLATYYSSARMDAFISFPTTMRTYPSATVASGTSYYAFYRNSGANTLNSLTLNEVSPNGCTLFNNTEASGAGGDCGWLYGNNSSAKILFSAEL